MAELAAAMATLELASGAASRAREFARIALAGEDDNSLAQVVDLQKRGLRFQASAIATTLEQRPQAHEAQAQAAYERSAWHDSWDAAVSWHIDQHFASTPARFRSFIAIVGLADPERCLQAAVDGLVANPNHVVLINNAAFACVLLGRLEAARSYLLSASSYVNVDPAEEASLMATAGLLDYVEGRPEIGAHRYNQARILAAKSGSRTLSDAVAVFHQWARVELGFDTTGPPLTLTEPGLVAMQARIGTGSLVLPAVARRMP